MYEFHCTDNKQSNQIAFLRITSHLKLLLTRYSLLNV